MVGAISTFVFASVFLELCPEQLIDVWQFSGRHTAQFDPDFLKDLPRGSDRIR